MKKCIERRKEMSLIAKDSGSSAPAIPEGMYQAVCYGIFDIGTQHSEKWGVDKHQCVIVWEIPEERIEVEGKNLPRTISKKYTVSIHEKAAMRKDLQSWRGKAFTPDELKGFDLRNVLGAHCMIQIIHTEKDGRKYMNIAAITPLVKGMTKKQAENTLAFYDMSSGQDLPDNTPKWIKEMIYQSLEFQERGEEPFDVTLPPDDSVPF